jgi:site-specific DNA-methyltransferase (adenine-specific)
MKSLKKHIKEGMLMKERIQLYNADCLKEMDKLIERGIKIDMILTDPPYGTTACKWDTIIPFDDMWRRVNRLIKDDGAIVLFGSQPFTSLLVVSNIKNHKYDLIWEKPQGVNPLLAKKQPLNNIEYIHVFYKKQPTYNPQFEEGKPYTMIRDKKERFCEVNNHTYKETKTINEGKRYPKRVLKFSRETGLHPTQKPVKLLEYLIKTYTNENELVLDFTMGSGSTGVACVNTNRRFIGIEKEEKYFNIAKERIEKVSNISFF